MKALTLRKALTRPKYDEKRVTWTQKVCWILLYTFSYMTYDFAFKNVVWKDNSLDSLPQSIMGKTCLGAWQEKLHLRAHYLAIKMMVGMEDAIVDIIWLSYPLGFFPKRRLLIPKGRVPESGLRPRQANPSQIFAWLLGCHIQVPDDW